MPLVAIAILSMNKIDFPLYANIFNIFDSYSIFWHLPYFIFGGILGSRKKLLDKFSTINPVINATLLLLSILFSNNYSSNNSLINKTVTLYFENLKIWTAATLCFFGFKTFSNKISAKWTFMPDASYTIYLFHYIFVIGIGLLILRNQTPIYIGLPLAMTASLAASLLIHKYFILRFKILRFLFNGK